MIRSFLDLWSSLVSSPAMSLLSVLPKPWWDIWFLSLSSISLAVFLPGIFFFEENSSDLSFWLVSCPLCVLLACSVSHTCEYYHITKGSYTLQGLTVEHVFLEGVVCTLLVCLWLLFSLLGVVVWAFHQVCFDLFVEVILGKRRRGWWRILSPNKREMTGVEKKDQAVTQRSCRA